MSAERDELDRIIYAALAGNGESTRAAADAILAAGYRKPRTVTTTDELHDAIRRSFEEGEPLVLMDEWKRPFILWEDDYGTVNVSSWPQEEDPERLKLNSIHLPATILHVGGER
jgi:hypothetical protein